MITAKEAAKIAETVADSTSKMQLEKVEAAIRDAAQKGWMDCDVPFLLSSKTQEVLKSLGYQIRVYDDNRGFNKEGTYTTMSWEKEVPNE